MRYRTKIIGVSLLLAAFLLAGCNGSDGDGELTLVIIAPSDGAELIAGEYVDITSLVSNPNGAARFLLLVNGQQTRDDSLTAPMHKGSMFQPWQPESPGTYSLLIRCFTQNSPPCILSRNLSVKY